MQHTLSNLLKGYVAGDQRVATALTSDSRQACPGCIFVAVKGYTVDGHQFIAKAIAAGAIAVVCERVPEGVDPGSALMAVVGDSAEALGVLASRWYGDPSRRLKLVGVTGTNGKTTIATLLYDMARLQGLRAGLMSTVANKIDDLTLEADHTTPDPITINRLLAQMVEAGCQFCSMECSSHACHQKRIAGLTFAGAIFTNLTRDHMDYHKTMANYLAAKKSFFDMLPAEAFALTNADDRYGMVMLQNTRARRFTYALQSPANFRCRMIEDRLDGMLIALSGAANGPAQAVEVHTAFTGRFNAYNLAAVYGASLLLGWDRGETLRCLSLLRPVDGRMLTVHGPGGVTAIIDYAHTPDAIANVLQAVAETGAAGIIAVVGAGGDRDKGKRPLMGAEGAKGSRLLVITSDNPRHEDPAAIASEVLAGVPADKRDATVVELDRAKAIAFALRQAKPGEAVVICGKGHETYQIIGDEKRHFSDLEQVKLNF